MSNNKNRILSLLSYLYKFTDEEHQITTGELLNLLHQQDIKGNCLTIKNDIVMLIEAGCDIVVIVNLAIDSIMVVENLNFRN